jgi:hypothetical protein
MLAVIEIDVTHVCLTTEVTGGDDDAARRLLTLNPRPDE